LPEPSPTLKIRGLVGHLADPGNLPLVVPARPSYSASSEVPMEDKVGSIVPSEKDIAARVEEVQKIAGAAKKYTVALTTDQRSRTLKPRSGFPQVAPKIAALAEKHKVSLPKISIDGMNADLTLAARLEVLRPAVATLLQRIDD